MLKTLKTKKVLLVFILFNIFLKQKKRKRVELFIFNPSNSLDLPTIK